jgi:putative membrane protein
MKSLTHPSFSLTGRALLASAIVGLVGATAAMAQSSSNTDRYNSSGSAQTNSPHDMNSMSNASNDNAASTTTAATNASSSRSSDKLGWSDRHFVTKTADGNQDEIQLAQLATERSSNADVKSFAQRLVDDHTKLASELSSLASSKNVKLDKESGQSRTYKRLAKASGSDFDREFVEQMIDEHEKDIKAFKDRADDAKDSELKQFAASHLATLQDHLQMAQNLRNSIVPTGRTDTTSGRGNMDTSTGKTTTTTGAIDNGTTGSATSASSGTSSTDDKRGGK